MKWKFVQVTEEAHELLTKWKDLTGVEIRHLASTAVKDAIYAREQRGEIIIDKESENNG